ncbi:MAG TPA: nucleotidyltransferase family protein, partial [Rugosimonospora sp.]|nr:nucleotidyltransferase family protein [Rugosimonospora sp.]
MADSTALPTPSPERDIRRADGSTALLRTLKRVADVLERAGIPFVLAGGFAVYARGGGLPEHDVDFLIREADAQAALESLAAGGLDPVRPPEGWLVKAYDGEELVDLIYRPVQQPVTDETLADSEVLGIDGSHLPVLSATRLMAYKLLSMNHHRCDFALPLEWARLLREQIDWPRLAAEVGGSPYGAAFLVLATRLGIAPAGPEGGAVDPAEPSVEARIQHLLAADDVAELGVRASYEGDAVVLRGDVNSPQRRDHIAARVAAELPAVPVRCEITVVEAEPPDTAEAL